MRQLREKPGFHSTSGHILQIIACGAVVLMASPNDCTERLVDGYISVAELNHCISSGALFSDVQYVEVHYGFSHYDCTNTNYGGFVCSEQASSPDISSLKLHYNVKRRGLASWDDNETMVATLSIVVAATSMFSCIIMLVFIFSDFSSLKSLNDDPFSTAVLGFLAAAISLTSCIAILLSIVYDSSSRTTLEEHVAALVVLGLVAVLGCSGSSAVLVYFYVNRARPSLVYPGVDDLHTHLERAATGTLLRRTHPNDIRYPDLAHQTEQEWREGVASRRRADIAEDAILPPQQNTDRASCTHCPLEEGARAGVLGEGIDRGIDGYLRGTAAAEVASAEGEAAPSSRAGLETCTAALDVCGTACTVGGSTAVIEGDTPTTDLAAEARMTTLPRGDIKSGVACDARQTAVDAPTFPTAASAAATDAAQHAVTTSHDSHGPRWVPSDELLPLSSSECTMILAKSLLIKSTPQWRLTEEDKLDDAKASGAAAGPATAVAEKEFGEAVELTHLCSS